MTQSMKKRIPSKETAIAASQSLKEREYWLNKLAGGVMQGGFPFDKLETNLDDPNERRMEQEKFEFTGELFSRLIGISGGNYSTLHMILVAGAALLLNKYTGSKDFIVATSIDKQELEGEFVNTVLPLRILPGDNITFKELLLQVRDTVNEAIENQNYPIDILMYDDLGLSCEDDVSLFETAVLLENIQDKDYIKHIRFNMVFSFLKANDSIVGTSEYNSTRYNKTTIGKIIDHFDYLLRGALFNVDSKLNEIHMLSPGEKKQVLVDFNNTRSDRPIDKTIHRLFEEQVEIRPGNTAVKYVDKELTYKELNENANRLARLLRRCGVRKDRTVGILLSRSPGMMESILAAWKAGGAYIPLDPQYPAQRIEQILKDSGTGILITLSEYGDIDKEAAHSGKVIRLDQAAGEIKKENAANLSVELGDDIDSLAYVIYTSGSTGKPKGVMVEHIGMTNHMFAKIGDLRMSETDIAAQNAAHTFDISIWQFFAALVTGGTTVIYPGLVVLDPERFMSRVAGDGITILEVVPSYLTVLLDTLDLKPQLFPSLTYLLVTGETLNPPLVQRWFEKYPDVKMVNAYGPTEASDDITHYIMDKPPETGRIPIGGPLQNFHIYIVDKYMNLCPIGVRGEICVSGTGVGRGYLNDEKRTRQVFIQDPFVEKQGVRLYKTGDIGRWLPGGTIEFFGRKDYQVKIRGYRIEPGEIESKLAEHPEIKEAVVIDKEEEKGNKYLCAYLVAVTGASPDVSAIKGYLLQHLPDYMIPAYILQLDEMPLTANGKINRKALPEPGITGQESMVYLSEKMLTELKYKKDKEHHEPSGDELEKFFNDIGEPAERERAVLQTHSHRTGKNCYPLTHSQKMIYYSEKRYSGTSCENLIYMIKYSKILDSKLLERAIAKVLLKNDAFRLRILEIEHESIVVPGQHIAEYKEQSLDCFDFSGEGGDQAMEEWIEANNRKPFQFQDSDLYYFAYIRFNEGESGYYMKFHHIVSDGWTTFLAAAEIDKTYEALQAGETIDDTPNRSYLSYISHEHAYLDSPQVKEDMKFWHTYLRPLPGAVSLSSKKAGIANIEGNVLTLPFPAAVREKMHRYRQTRETSLFKLLLAALSIYVSRVTGVDDFVIGTLNHNRALESHRETAGTFIRFIPIRIKIDHRKDFQRFVEEIGENLDLILKDHQKYPFEFLINELRAITGVDPGYFFNINLIGHPDVKAKNFKIQHYFSAYEPTQLSIHINFANRDIDGTLELEWDYQEELFSSHNIERIHQGLSDILAEALANPGKIISEIRCLPGKEKDRPDTRMPEIERKLLTHKDITAAAVVTNNAIVERAFIVSGKALAASQLRDFLSLELSPVNISTSFVRLEKMPLTPGGEIDRKLLHEIEINLEPGYIGPRNETEKRLLNIWMKELGLRAGRSNKGKIGISDNFFTSGGDSIKSISLINRINREFNTDLKMVDLYSSDTIEKLAQRIEAVESPGYTGEYKDTLQEMENIKEEFLSGF